MFKKSFLLYHFPVTSSEETVAEEDVEMPEGEEEQAEDGQEKEGDEDEAELEREETKVRMKTVPFLPCLFQWFEKPPEIRLFD